MRSQWYKGAVVAALIAAIGAPVAAAEAADPAGTAGVARVNGAAISRAQLDAAIELQRVNAGATGSDAAAEQQLQQAALEQLIAFELLWQEARQRGVVVDDAAVDQAFAARRERFDDEAAFLAQLETMGFSAAAYRDNLRRSLSVRRLLDEERDAVAVSKAEVQTFYEQEQELMRRPDEIRVRHILFSRPEGDDGLAAKRADAEALLARIRAGEDFVQLAALYSEGPSRKHGGDLGYFSAGKMVEAFEAAAFALQDPGDVSDVVETEYGFHIIRLEGRRAGEIAAFEDVAIQIHDHLRQVRAGERIAQLTEQLRGRADIEVLIGQ
ncbi:MAG: peptidylprolyl isomerase [Gammaproteobacteria bacterium]|nr:peptidylprolyl isomerase [Gammaproteobacteria bacterium]